MNLSYKQRESIRSILAHTPMARRARRHQLSPGTSAQLEDAVRHAIKYCPLYAPYKDLIADGFDLSKLPIIRKPDIKGRSHLMVSRNIPKFLRLHKRTSGSTGIPLDVYFSPLSILKKDIIANYLFELIDPEVCTGVLRDHTTNGEYCQQGGSRHWVYSPYKLSADTLDDYIKSMNDNRVTCLHVYPSALMIFAKLIKQRYHSNPLPGLKGILASSEIFSRDDKEFILEVFPGIKLIDLYGHNEQACCAYAEGLGNYHFFSGYGHVEFIDSGERVNGNKVCEIVATSIANRTMPFIRYGTLDYAEVDKDGKVVSIIGRSSDFIVNRHGNVVPCLFLNRRESTKNVINRQYYQSAPGKMCLRVVVNDHFDEIDRRLLLEDMITSFGETFDCEVVVVDTIERSARGKQKRLVRDFDI